MITVKIIKNGYGHKEGQVFSCSEFEAGHLMAFGYAVTYQPQPKIETQMIAPIENRKINHIPMPNIQTEVTPNPIEIKVEEKTQKLKKIFTRKRSNKKI